MFLNLKDEVAAQDFTPLSSLHQIQLNLSSIRGRGGSNRNLITTERKL
jgi:hypothetical protein